MTRLLLLLAALFAASPALAAGRDAGGGDAAEFCHFHPDLDEPGLAYFGPQFQPGQVPQQVEDIGASDWRCMDGAALLCANSADGTTCSRPNPSRVPDRMLRAICRDTPGLQQIPLYAISQYASVWRCRGREPVIIHTARLDRRGYMAGAWVRLLVRNGRVIAPQPNALPDDPRGAWLPR